MKLKQAMRASAWRAKRRRSSNSQAASSAFSCCGAAVGAVPAPTGLDVALSGVHGDVIVTTTFSADVLPAPAHNLKARTDVAST
jgi:hypothetical protein